MLDNFKKEIVSLITTPCTRPHVPQSFHSQPNTTARRSIPTEDSISVDAANIVLDAMRFANNESTQARNVRIEKSRSFKIPSCVLILIFIPL